MFVPPKDALRLIKGGVPIKKLNIGNLHFAEGKKQLSPTISVTEDDIATFKELHDLGIELSVQGIPNEKETDMMDLLAKA